jgi:hypothetical protein
MFKVTKEDVKKSAICPPGMHISTVISVEEPYYNDNKTLVQRMDLETASGHTLIKFFNNKFTSDIIEFVQAADNIVLGDDMGDMDVDLADYIGKKIAVAVSHGKDKNDKIQAQVVNFYPADKVPF